MVEYITYKGEKHPVRVFYKSIMLFQKETGKTINEIATDLEALGILFYYSLQRGYELEGKVFNISKDEAFDMLDECWLEFQSVAFKFFPKSKDVGIDSNELKKKS